MATTNNIVRALLNVALEQAAPVFPRRGFALGDAIDATIAAVTAKLGAGRYENLSEYPPTDSWGLRIEMVCLVPA